MFWEWPSDKFVRHIEGRGHGLRKRLGLKESAALDPRQLVGTYKNMDLLDLGQVVGHMAELEVLQRNSSAWSAMAYRENGGVWLITWNPWHAETRIRASMMEEVAHIILDHASTKLIPDPILGLPQRTYSPSKEKEALFVAGAPLVPYNGMMDMLACRRSGAEIAAQYQVSEALVQMRLNLTGAQSAVPQSLRR